VLLGIATGRAFCVNLAEIWPQAAVVIIGCFRPNCAGLTETLLQNYCNRSFLPIGPGRVIDPCACVRTIAFALNDL